MIGQMLSHYRIEVKLGEGGMGVVWKATDTKLDRQVAIKVLPDELARDQEHLARFEREAKVLATLNHRNIAAIYGIDEADGKRFLVMELVEGENLSKRIDRGPLPVDEALDFCHQLARALEAAHEKGVLHRDLKPANVQVTPEGRVKVLDFGLAKAFEEQADASKSPTLTSAGTRAGTILGTAGYMSPEQARGKPLDKRTDIWSFGCVLFECLTGRAPFKGETVSDTLAAILKSEPSWAELPGRTPARIRELLQRALDKEVRNRLRDIGDARIELQRTIGGRDSLTDVSGSVPALGPAGETSRTVSLRALVAAAVFAAVAGAASWALLSGSLPLGRAGSARTTRLSMTYPDGFQIGATLLAPDGRSIVFRATRIEAPSSERDPGRLFVRALESYQTQPVIGSEGTISFALSPDGRWIAMLVPVSEGSASFRLTKVPLDGSAPPLALTDWKDEWSNELLWLPDGDIVTLAHGSPQAIVRIPSGGGSAEPPVEVRPVGFEGTIELVSSNASGLPGGVHVLVVAVTYSERGYEQNVATLNLGDGEVRIQVENANSPQWSPTGHLLFSRSDSLLAVSFDVASLAPIGGQVAISDGLRANAIWEDADFQLASNGTLLHWPGGVVGGRRSLAIAELSGKIVREWSSERRPFESLLTVSPDGRRMAVTMVNEDALYDVWVSDVDRPRLSMLVHEKGRDCQPQIWTPDGERLVYSCNTATGGHLYVGPGDGVGAAVELLDFPGDDRYLATGVVGDELVLTHVARGSSRVVRLQLEPGATPTAWIEDASAASVSPDGRWTAYQSSRSGKSEVYLRRIGADAELGPEIPVSSGGGLGGIWATAENVPPLTLRYVQGTKVISVTVTPGRRVTISEPQQQGDIGDLLQKLRGPVRATLPDDRLIVVLRGDDEEPPREANLVLGWLAELKQRVP